jgi:uncharacterized protein (TIGR00369 family)
MVEARNPDWQRMVERGFADAPFVHENGIRLVACGPGWVESAVDLRPQHRQHHGFAHGGLIATMADHTAGAAAFSVTTPEQAVLTAEFKLSLLRATRAPRLVCRGEVLKSGSQLVFAESSVEAEEEGRRTLVARASVTLAVVGASRTERA